MTGGMDTEPPDDDSMGGGNESEQGKRQKMRGFCQNCPKKPRGPYQRETNDKQIFIFLNSMFPSVSVESREEPIMRKLRPKTYWPSGRIRACVEDEGRIADTFWEGRR